MAHGFARRRLAPAVLCSLLAAARLSQAWVYPEHRDIALRALEELDPVRRAALERLWAAARQGNESRFCPRPAEAEQGENVACIDYAAWPAIAGDHSCSGQQLLETLQRSDWILDVAAVAARLKRGVSTAPGRSSVINALRRSDIDLQRADPEYATRAGSNNVHFLLARPSVGVTPEAYGALALSPGAEINALAAYAWYHLEAIDKARALAGRRDLAAGARAVLADEAMALHFLQDVFAAGHVAGTWGNAALRKGTHDYYNEAGLAVTTWAGERAVLAGDAWMRPEDSDRAARSVRASLAQVLDAALGPGPDAPDAAHAAGKLTRAEPGTLDLCRIHEVPRRVMEPRAMLVQVLRDTPIPMLASGLGEMPRFRAELGPFLGVQAAARGTTLKGGFGASQSQIGANAGLELGLRIGFGLEGVMNETGDGLVFLDLGVRQDGSSTHRFGDEAMIPEAGAITSAVPARLGYVTRLRMPFWLLPLDLLLAGPILLLVSPTTLQKMAVVAGNGGVIPWQSAIATPLGRFQFILGREVGVTFFGYGEQKDRLVVPQGGASGSEYALLGLSSIQLDLPVLEYRPFRSFSRDQSSSVLLQLFVGADVPTRTSVVAPVGAREPETEPIWYSGIRFSFDWRYYL